MTQANAEDPIALWERFATRFPEAERLDVTAELVAVQRECIRESRESLRPWLEILDEALHVLLRLVQMAQSRLQYLQDPRHGRAFLLLVGRACALMAAIRRLITSGLEDAAGPIARSLIETVGLALVTACDCEFAELIDQEPYDYDPNEFWKKHVGYGRLSTRLEKIFEAAGYSAEERANLIQDRVGLAQNFSGSLHSSIRSATGSFFVPLLGRPGYYGIRLLGNISIDSPRLLFVTAEMIHEMSVTLCRLMERDQIPLFVGAPWNSTMANFYTAFLTLQELIKQRGPALEELEARWEAEHDVVDAQDKD